MAAARTTIGDAPPWAVLFLSAASPGAVLRFFERRRRRDPDMPPALLLSDAVGAEGIRLLTAETDEVFGWLSAQGRPLSAAFPKHVTLLRRQTNDWGFHIWDAGAEIEQGGGASPPSTPRPLWMRLPGFYRPLAPECAWAQTRGLPLGRLRAPLMDYVTVAQLDQKGLLVEASPRLYRFPL